MRLCGFTIGWLFGLWLTDRLQLAWYLYFIASIATILIIIYIRKSWRIMLIAIYVGTMLGVVRMLVNQNSADPDDIRQQIGMTTRLEGIIVGEPQWTPLQQRVVLAVQAYEHNQQRVAAAGQIMLTLPAEPPRSNGERLLVSGTIITPSSSPNFDYAAYLRRRSIYAMLEPALLEQALPATNSPHQRLLALKQRSQTIINQTLPQPQAAVLIGMLLGVKSSVPTAVWETFNRTGLSHILVISGWNITIVVAALLGLGKALKLNQRHATALAIAAIVVYVAFVGANGAVIRAALMGAIVALAQPLGRKADAWAALAAAIWLMTLIDPQALWDLGFQLSALATASLFAWGNPIEAKLRLWLRWPWLEWMIEPLTATLAAQIWALPIILYHFGNLSLIAPVANVLIVPVVPLIMASGAVLACLGLFGRWLAFLALPITWASLTWVVRVAEWLADLPWAAVEIPQFSVIWLLLAYGLSIGLWLYVEQRAKNIEQRARGEDSGIRGREFNAEAQRGARL